MWCVCVVVADVFVVGNWYRLMSMCMNLEGPVWGCRRLCISYIYIEETK